MTHILTLDLGTTLLKAALFDEDGREIAVCRKPTPTTHPNAGWAVIDPATFRQAICSLLIELREMVVLGFTSVSAVTFAAQTNSFLLLDERDRPVTPLILWCDRRACHSMCEFQSTLDRMNQYNQTGVPHLGDEFMAAKLLWLRASSPESFSQAHRLSLLSDLLTFWLTGRHVTEAGVAGLTGMFDIHELAWREPAVTALALEEIALPIVQRAGTDLGQIDQAFAAELGIPIGCRVVLGCLDQYAGAVGAGNVKPGMMSETTGTVLATVRCSDSFEPELARRGVFQGPGHREGLYYEMVFGEVSANILEAYRRQWPNPPAYELLNDEASRVPDGAEGLRFDRLDGDTRVLFDGRTAEHHRGHEVRAIFEAVAESLNEQVNLLCKSASPHGLVSVGGAARNDLWLAIKASRLGCPITATQCEEPTSLGAAILAASVIGREPVESIARRWVRCRVTIKPHAA